MTRRLVVSFDGTWNTPGDDGDIGKNGVTNVWRLHQAIADGGADGVPQLAHYEAGVGTRWYNRLPGGTFGAGLSRIIREGYRFLVDTYQEGDRLYVFGFSRGAYSARSLVGMLRNVGLLQKEHRRRIGEAEQLYRARDEGADAPNAQAFRQKFSHEVDVQCLGVWDTVGALGVPINSFDWFNRRYYEFHDTELSGIVRHAYHAVAIDEHRASYDATLWDPKDKPRQTVEQAWFVGAHCNVGGGYPDNRLADLPLLWMAERAEIAGLHLDHARLPARPDPLAAEPVDSYKAFLGGAYSRFADRRFRPLGRTAFGNESVHPSVVERLAKDTRYRPHNPAQTNLEGVRLRQPGPLGRAIEIADDG